MRQTEEDLNNQRSPFLPISSFVTTKSATRTATLLVPPQPLGGQYMEELRANHWSQMGLQLGEPNFHHWVGQIHQRASLTTVTITNYEVRDRRCNGCVIVSWIFPLTEDSKGYWGALHS
jgi:hypothetical protein